MTQFQTHTVEFKLDGKPNAFVVIHNLPNVKGLSIEDAVMNWIYRTRKFTAENFCQYIRSKNTGHVCYTQEEYNSMMQNR
jgi:hypothetical protein